MSPQVKGTTVLYIAMFRQQGEDWGCKYEPQGSLEKAQEWIKAEMLSDIEHYEYVIVTGQITHTASKTAVVFTPVKAPAKKTSTKKPVKKAAKN